jgi:hypothetical protein
MGLLDVRVESSVCACREGCIGCISRVNGFCHMVLNH